MLSNKSIQDSYSAVPAVKNESTAPDMPLLASGRKKRWSHGSLFFSLFFFVPLIISRPLPIETWVLQTLGYLSFVILYIKAINQPVKTLPTYLLLMFLLSVACSFQNPGGATIIGFIAFIVGYYNSLKTGIMSIGVMMLVLVSLHITVFNNAHFLLSASLLNSLVLFGFGVMERKETLHSLKESQQAEALRVLSAIAEREYNSLKTGIMSIGVMMLVLVSLHITVFNNAHFLLSASLLNSLVLFGFGVMERKETLHSLKESQQAEALRVLSAIAERERIGRDLHDVAGHALSSISLKAQLADKLISKDKIEDAHREVKALAQLSQALLSDIRQAVSDIKQLSLSDEIAKDKSLLEENGFNVTTDIEGGAEARLSAKQESQLALIIKELTTNTLRYSNGNAVSLDLEVNEQTVKMTYKDHGVVENTASIKEGNGLMGIRERAASIHADVDISFLPHPIVRVQLTAEQALSHKASL